MYNRMHRLTSPCLNHYLTINLLRTSMQKEQFYYEVLGMDTNTFKLSTTSNALSHSSHSHLIYIDLLSKVQLSFSVVVCYGIGHVGSCPIAQQQFAFLLLIMEQLQPSQSLLYDPVLVREERKAVELSGCTLFPKNDVRHFQLYSTPFL